jgi:hypothetical protein
MCKFVRGDASCVRDPNPKLLKWQEDKVGPKIELFKKLFGVTLKPTKSMQIGYADLNEETVLNDAQVEILRKYLHTLVSH